MEVEQRLKRYAAIEEHRQRPLIVYATSTRQGVPGRMASDAIRILIDQIEPIESEVSIDVLIHSAGGDALTAWKLMSLLRERFDTVGVLVPYMAFSAATIFALGADEIVMHPNASLGPIDPQVTVTLPDRSKHGWEVPQRKSPTGWSTRSSKAQGLLPNAILKGYSRLPGLAVERFT